MILNTVKNIFDSKYRKSILHDKKNLDIEESYHSLSVSSSETNIKANTKSIIESKSGETKYESDETNIEANTNTNTKSNLASKSDDIKTKPNSDSSIYLEPKETTYSLYGKVVEPTIFKDKIWWIVDVNDPSEIQKLNRPGMLGYSAMFLHEPVSNKKNLNNYRFFKLNQIVKVNITYNEKGCVMYMKNTIDMSDKLHLD
jgi:hypothetical protein